MKTWRKYLFYLLPPLLALLVVLSVNFKTDLSAFIIAGENAEEILLASEMQSGALSRRYLISIGLDENTRVSKDFINKLKTRFSEVEGVLEVWSPGQRKEITNTMQTLYSHFGSALYSLEPERDLAQIFTAQGLEQRAELLKKALLSPQSAMIKQIAVNDPLLLTLNGFQALTGQKLKQDTNYRILILETTASGMDAVEQGRIQKELNTIFSELNQLWPEQYKLEMTGVAVFAVATQTLIQGDIVRISIFSTIALVLLFLLIFRSYIVLFQVFTLLAIVILTSILSTQLVFGYVHGMTIAIGSTLVGICIDYPIHAIAHAQAVASNQSTAMIARIWPSMLLGGVTTMIGYIALGISGYPGFQQVALYAATGIVVSLVLTRFVLPGLVTSTHRHLVIPLVSNWVRFCLRFRSWLIMILLLTVSASLFGLKSLSWMEDMQELTPELDYLKQNDKRIRGRMTSIEPGRFVLVVGENIEAALQKSEQVYPELERLKFSGMLSDYVGLYPWLLSAQAQKINNALLQKQLTDENLLLWQQALKKQGLKTKRLGHFGYNLAQPLLFQNVLETPVKKLIDSRVIIGEKQSIIMIWLAKHDPEAVKAAMDKIEGVQYFSQRDMLNNMTKDYTARAQRLLTVGLILIILLLVIRYKSLLKTIQTLLPAVLAAFLILGLWSLSGASVSFLHLVGFLLVVAICVDYGIFYQENRGGDISLTYQAMAASMLTSALAFGSLMAADSTSLKILSGVVAFGVLLGFLLCPLIIKTKSTLDEKSTVG